MNSPFFLADSLQINAQKSVSMACAVVSAVTVYRYQLSIHDVLSSNIFDPEASYRTSSQHFFAGKDAKHKLDDQEKAMIAISSLVLIFSIIEIALAVGGARSSDLRNQPPQENQVSLV